MSGLYAKEGGLILMLTVNDTITKDVTREEYDALSRLADDGCPLVTDLEDFEVIDTDIQTGG